MIKSYSNKNLNRKYITTNFQRTVKSIYANKWRIFHTAFYILPKIADITDSACLYNVLKEEQHKNEHKLYNKEVISENSKNISQIIH